MTTYTVDIQNDFEYDNLPTDRMTKAICFVLDEHNTEPDTTITVVITDDDNVQQLNLQFRGVDAPTDVLSFPSDPLPEEIRGEDEPPYLGDLIMAYPYTWRHAQEENHTIDDELILLSIHGTLHLLGYDHDNEQNQARMWNAQANALKAFGVAIEVPLFTFDGESEDYAHE